MRCTRHDAMMLNIAAITALGRSAVASPERIRKPNHLDRNILENSFHRPLFLPKFPSVRHCAQPREELGLDVCKRQRPPRESALRPLGRELDPFNPINLNRPTGAL